jgi:hypothetical protein
MAAEREKSLAGPISKLVLTYSQNYLIMILGNLFLGPSKNTFFWPTLVSNRLECLSLTSFSQSSTIFATQRKCAPLEQAPALSQDNNL